MGEEMGGMGSTRKWRKKCEAYINKELLLKLTLMELYVRVVIAVM
jgi:hypothetical protein